MIEEILPAVVASAAAVSDPPDATLFPEEAALLHRAVDKRRREFSTARACARAALAALGLPAVPILPGPRGEPRWPDGVVGSMTHCAGYRAAAVGRTRDVAGVGIDAEPNDVLPDGVLDMVSLPAEQAWISALSSRQPGTHWDRLLFSAKESVFKTWYPLTGEELGFSEALVTVDPVGRRFTVRLLVPGPVLAGRPLTGFDGQWVIRDGVLATAIVVPAAGPAA